jgi:tRNA A-37 threonylcarbamoyl transferase component Bud32
LIWYDEGLFRSPRGEIFSLDYWKRQGAVIPTGSGRGSSWFVQTNQAAFVLRHYRRGGWVGKFLKDTYLIEPMTQTRAMKEYALLERLFIKGLPVPRPCAARAVRTGVGYRADILIERIPDARNLVEILGQTGALSSSLWCEVGRVIARFHQNGVDHADLNAHNILVDSKEKVWVIDLDKSRVRRSGKWEAKMLARLYRSLQKEAQRLPNFCWQESDWSSLLEGYVQQTATPSR